MTIQYKEYERNFELFGLKRGEIRTVTVGDSPSRHALILELCEEEGEKWALVMYMHDVERMATSVDLILSSDSPTCDYDGVLQTDLYTTCSLHQIGDIVGTVGEHELECMNQVFRNADVVSDYHYKGTRMGATLEEAQADDRWQFKVVQGDWARLAQSDSLRILLDTL